MSVRKVTISQVYHQFPNGRIAVEVGESHARMQNQV
jgi:hypothetical protein